MASELTMDSRWPFADDRPFDARADWQRRDASTTSGKQVNACRLTDEERLELFMLISGSPAGYR